MAKISVMAPGGWGTALAILGCENSHDITVWGKFAAEIEEISSTRKNRLLPGVRIPEKIKFTANLDDVSDSDVIIISTPSFAVRETAALLRKKINADTIIISVAKGFERDTLKRFSEVIAEELPDNPVVVLSGPSHAEEVAVGVPTSIVAASTDDAAAKAVQEMFMCDSFRIYTNADVIGVEVGAATKNIIAMATGICDGMGLGDNTAAALMTRGMSEITRLGVKMGADRETFAGLSGIGDLIVTCTSRHSRNRRFGKLLGEGMNVDDALKSVSMTVESYYATEAVKKLADKYGVEMPITEKCYDILFGGGEVKSAIKELMSRAKKSE